MRSLLVMFRNRSPARHKVLMWVREEWEKYGNAKLNDRGIWSEDLNDQMLREGGLRQDGYWFNQVWQYWARAEVLGLDTPAGRQQAFKAITTMIDCGSAIIRVYGNPPLPGYPSGEIHQAGDGSLSQE